MQKEKHEKLKNFLFANIGGLLAVAAVFLEAGGLREKIVSVAATQAALTVSVAQAREEIQAVKTDVAVLKATGPYHEPNSRR